MATRRVEISSRLSIQPYSPRFPADITSASLLNTNPMNAMCQCHKSW